MRIRSTEIEIILDDLLEKKRNTTNVSEFLTLVKLQEEWEEKWLEVADLEENESVLDWLDSW